jgi:hypothetical protein
MAQQFIIKDVAGNTGLADAIDFTTDLAEAQRIAARNTSVFKLGYADFRVFEMIEVES